MESTETIHGRSRLRTGRGGFTLLEIVVSLMILGILTSSAYPYIMDGVHRSRIDQASRIVAADLRQAVALASRQGTPVRIVFLEDEPALRIEQRSSGTVLHSRAMGAETEVPLASASMSPAAIDVFPNRVTSGPLTITLEAGRHSATVAMSSAAFVRTVQP